MNECVELKKEFVNKILALGAVEQLVEALDKAWTTLGGSADTKPKDVLREFILGSLPKEGQKPLVCLEGAPGSVNCDPTKKTDKISRDVKRCCKFEKKPTLQFHGVSPSMSWSFPNKAVAEVLPASYLVEINLTTAGEVGVTGGCLPGDCTPDTASCKRPGVLVDVTVKTPGLGTLSAKQFRIDLNEKLTLECSD